MVPASRGHHEPEELKKRGGTGYSEVALSIMKAVAIGSDFWAVVNVPNRGIVRCLPDDDVIERRASLHHRHQVGGDWRGVERRVRPGEELRAAGRGGRPDGRPADGSAGASLGAEYEVLVPLLNDLLKTGHK
ncbi:MAG TPA: hypothetical protein VD973_10120 [Symbiobacteriaceae bacterium]|nr:hypothetical protein [Symbiobacteriaceae bacterium]